jgi:7-keto-8-aminopelargonate synthetase-like enzyme
MNQKSISKRNDSLFEVVNAGIQYKVGHLNSEDAAFNGKEITIEGQKMINFASCSHLGLALDNRLKQGAKEGLERYGNSFPTSRSFVSMGYLNDLENKLEKLFGYPCLLTTSTSLGHVGWLPLLVGPDDLVILDHQVHSSVAAASQLLKAQGSTMEVIRHNRMELLEQKLLVNKNKYNKIWYLADGIYSMYGDLAPMDEIVRLLNTYDNFHVYIDDAHGMSWKGKNGVGHVLEKHPLHERMALITSLGKSFGSLGGVMIFKNEHKKKETKIMAGPLIFSSPMVPAVIGASLASAKIHLSNELPALQRQLTGKINLFKENALKHGLPFLGSGNTPIFFVPIGEPQDVFAIGKEMMQKGFYQSPSVFPSVPLKNGGLRFTITNWVSEEAIVGMLKELAVLYHRHLSPEKRNLSFLQKRFKGSLTLFDA